MLLLRGTCVGVTGGTLQAEVLHGAGCAFWRAVVVDDRASKDASGEQRQATSDRSDVRAVLAQLLVDGVDLDRDLRGEHAQALLDCGVRILDAGVGLSSELRQTRDLHLRCQTQREQCQQRKTEANRSSDALLVDLLLLDDLDRHLAVVDHVALVILRGEGDLGRASLGRRTGDLAVLEGQSLRQLAVGEPARPIYRSAMRVAPPSRPYTTTGHQRHPAD